MKTKEKKLYEAPLTSFFKVKTEGVICVSASMDEEWEEFDA